MVGPRRTPSTRRRFGSLVTVLLSVLWSVAEARAEGRPRIAVVVAAPPDARRELEQALVHQRRVPVELRLSSLPNAGAAGTSETEADWAERLATARRAYIEADFEGCLAALPDDASLAPVLASGERVLSSRVLVWRTACELGRGSVAEARRRALELATLGLELPPDVGAVAPDAERLLAEALRVVATAPRVDVRVNSDPSSLEVWIDGRAFGCVTPCDVSVPHGEHLFGVRGDGVSPATQRSRVDATVSRISLRAEPASPELARVQWAAHYGAAGAIDSAPSLRLLATAVPAERLVLLATEAGPDGKLAVRAAYAARGVVSSRASSEPVRENKLAGEGVALLEELLVRGNVIEKARPLWKNVWFWTAVTVVAAGAATTAALLVKPPNERTEVSF